MGKVEGPGGYDFGRLPTSNRRPKAKSPTARAKRVVCDNMRSNSFLDRTADETTDGLERRAASCSLYTAARRQECHMSARARIMFLHVKVVAGNTKRKIATESRVRYRPRLLAKVA
jgi:hypothetical protein